MSSSSKFPGRVVIVTGGSQGVGLGISQAFLKTGAAVVSCARKPFDGCPAATSDDERARSMHVQADIRDEAQIDRVIAETLARFGRLDVLVNNAGVMLLGAVEGADTAEWRRMVEVNCLGLLYCTRAALPLLREDGGGHVVNVSSVAGRIASFGSAVYNMTKWGVVGFSEGLRQEALHSNVRVTVIEPGYVETELQGHNTNPIVIEGARKMAEEIGEVLQAEDIAEAIRFAVCAPARVSVNEILVRPTGQRR